MPLSPGDRIGPYEIVSLLGAGAMGQVYRARDTNLGRMAAIKVLPDAFLQDRERRARFQREAKVLAALNHPNIAAVYGWEERGGSSALVMELVEGRPLNELIPRKGMPLDRRSSSVSRLRAASRRLIGPASCIAISNRPTSWSPPQVS
jgi:serine/threonine protein kinase